MKEGTFLKKESFMLMFGILLSIILLYATLGRKEQKEYAQCLKQAFLKAWKAYKDYVWGKYAISSITERAKTLNYTIGLGYSSNKETKRHSGIIDGGELKFTLGATPNKDWFD